MNPYPLHAFCAQYDLICWGLSQVFGTSGFVSCMSSYYFILSVAERWPFHSSRAAFACSSLQSVLLPHLSPVTKWSESCSIQLLPLTLPFPQFSSLKFYLQPQLGNVELITSLLTKPTSPSRLFSLFYRHSPVSPKWALDGLPGGERVEKSRRQGGKEDRVESFLVLLEAHANHVFSSCQFNGILMWSQLNRFLSGPPHWY